MIELDLPRLRVLLASLENWHYWRAGELIDEDDRIAAELAIEIEDAILEAEHASDGVHQGG